MDSGHDADGTRRRLRWAETAIREYAPNGAGIAQVVRERFTAELQAVPADSLASILVPLTRTDALFSTSKALERASYGAQLPNFDQLAAAEKSFLGAVLDFAQIERAQFAKAWSRAASSPTFGSSIDEVQPESGPKAMPSDRLI